MGAGGPGGGPGGRAAPEEAGRSLSLSSISRRCMLRDPAAERCESVDALRGLKNIARRANREDECTGQNFGRAFKLPILLDEASLLACCRLRYLNPIRAADPETPETATNNRGEGSH